MNLTKNSDCALGATGVKKFPSCKKGKCQNNVSFLIMTGWHSDEEKERQWKNWCSLFYRSQNSYISVKKDTRQGTFLQFLRFLPSLCLISRVGCSTKSDSFGLLSGGSPTEQLSLSDKLESSAKHIRRWQENISHEPLCPQISHIHIHTDKGKQKQLYMHTYTYEHAYTYIHTEKLHTCNIHTCSQVHPYSPTKTTCVRPSCFELFWSALLQHASAINNCGWNDITCMQPSRCSLPAVLERTEKWQGLDIDQTRQFPRRVGMWRLARLSVRARTINSHCLIGLWERRVYSWQIIGLQKSNHTLALCLQRHEFSA